MATNRDKRLKIFRQGAKAISRYCCGDDSVYFCPICGRGFLEEEIESTGQLSLEHVPPESVGGKKLLLTCKECNGNAGKTIDSAALKRKNFDNFHNLILEGEENGPIKGVFLEIPNCRVCTEVSRSNGVTNFKLLGGRANTPEIVERFKQEFPEQGEFKLTKTFNYEDRFARISDLKSGFLLVTAWLGYRYAFDPKLEIVRQQIYKPEENVLSSQFWIETDGREIPPQLIVEVKEPLPFLAVTFGRRVIILPDIDSPDSFYDELENKWKKKGRVTITGRKFSWPQQPYMHLDILE